MDHQLINQNTLAGHPTYKVLIKPFIKESLIKTREHIKKLVLSILVKVKEKCLETLRVKNRILRGQTLIAIVKLENNL